MRLLSGLDNTWKLLPYITERLSVALKYGVIGSEIATYANISGGVNLWILRFRAFQTIPRMRSTGVSGRSDSSHCDIDSRVRAWASRLEAFALLGQPEEAIQLCAEVLTSGIGKGNLYAQIRAFHAFGICSATYDVHLAMAALARAQQLCEQYRYGTGERHITGVLETVNTLKNAEPGLFNQLIQHSPEDLEKRIVSGLRLS